MFDVRDLSNATIVLLIIMVFASAATARALMNPIFAPATYMQSTMKTHVSELAVDPNMSFNVLSQDVRVKVGDTFVVTVTVENVTDMFGWQVFLRFDPTILNAVGVSLPSGHVLSSSVTVSSALAAYDSAEFSGGPLQKVRNDEGWVLAGDCMLGANQQTVSGSGVLCQVEFKALSPGSTILRLLHDTSDSFQTFNLNFDLDAITASSPSYSMIHVLPN